MICYKKPPHVYVNETVSIDGKDIHGCTVIKVLSFRGAEIDYNHDDITYITYTAVTPDGKKYHKWTTTYCDPAPYQWNPCQCEGEC